MVYGITWKTGKHFSNWTEVQNSTCSRHPSLQCLRPWLTPTSMFSYFFEAAMSSLIIVTHCPNMPKPREFLNTAHLVSAEGQLAVLST